MLGRVLLISGKPSYSREYCVVCGVSNKHGLSLFKIPDNKRTEWLERVGRTHFLQKNYEQNFICENHFPKEHILVWGQGDHNGGLCHKRLKPDAQPVIPCVTNCPRQAEPAPNYRAEKNYCRKEPVPLKTEPEHTTELILDSIPTVGEEKDPALIKMVSEDDNELDLPVPVDTVQLEDENDWPPIDQETIFEHQHELDTLENDTTERETEYEIDRNYCREEPMHIVMEPEHTSELLLDSIPTVKEEKEPALIKMVSEDFNELPVPVDLVQVEVVNDRPPIDQETIFDDQHELETSESDATERENESEINRNYCREERAEPMHIVMEPEHTSELLLYSIPTVKEEKEPALIKMVLEEDNELPVPVNTVQVEVGNDWPPIDQETIFEHQHDSETSELSDTMKSENQNQSEIDRVRFYYNIIINSIMKSKEKEKPKCIIKEIEEKPEPINTTVKESTPDIYLCDHCGLCYNNSSSFNHHMIGKHTEDKPFMCDKCPLRFKFRSLLNAHVSRVHNGGDRKLACEVCNKIISRDGLRAHMKIHLGIKSHKCEICEECFLARESLKRHMLVHTGETRHACSYCDRKFSREDNLRTHLRTHTLEKPFVCDTCGEAYSHRVSLKTHVLKYHDNEREEGNTDGVRKKKKAGKGNNDERKK